MFQDWFPAEPLNPVDANETSASERDSSESEDEGNFTPLFSDPDMNAFANEFMAEICISHISKAKSNRLWHIATRHSRYDAEQLGSFRSVLRKVQKRIPQILQKWKVKDLRDETIIRGQGEVYPARQFSNKKRFSLEELWTSVRLKDILKFHLAIHPESRNTYLKANGKIDYSKFELDLTCDGIPYANSSSHTLYLSCVRIYGCKNIYVLNSRHAKGGVKKEIKDYLGEFVEDANKLGVKVKKVLGDTPIRSFLKRLKGHNGHYSCEFCETKGVLVGRHVFYPSSTRNAPLRTNQRWRRHVRKIHKWRQSQNIDNVKGVLGKSPLLKLSGFDIVRHAPPDSLHRDHLGISKTTWKLVTNTKKTGRKLHFANAQKLIDHVNEAYCRVRLPCEFSHRSRDVEVPVFKGHEWKSLMFTAFPSVVAASYKYQGNLVGRIWALYVFLLRVYVAPEAIYRSLDQCWLRKLHKEFYKKYEKAFGKDNCAFNIHSFYHMNITRECGQMHETSTEPFESFYGKVLEAYKAGTLAIGKQFIVKMYMYLLRHTENYCQRKLHFDIMKRSKKIDDSLLTDEEFNFFKVVETTQSTVTVKIIQTDDWFCPENNDLQFHKVGVKKFVKYLDEEITYPKTHFTGKAALFDTSVIMGMQKDVLFS